MDSYDETPSDQPAQKTAPPRRGRWGKVLVVLLVLILLAAVGWLAWQLKLTADREAKANADKQHVQSQLDAANKQLKALQAASTAATPAISPLSPAASPCSPQTAISQSLQENLAAAINSKNTAALEGYMASSVNVVFAASEKMGNESPAQAVADMDYLNKNATDPWDFNLPAATVNAYKAGDYKQYFDGRIYVGKSANNYVVAFGFDDCAKVNRIFVSASDELL